jgi:hypothetical protein
MTGGRSLGSVLYAAEAVVGIRIAVAAAGEGVAGAFTGGVLDGNPGLEEAGEIDDAKHEGEEDDGDEGELDQRLSLIAAKGEGSSPKQPPRQRPLLQHSFLFVVVFVHLST